jgi:hypothetical protein
MTDKPITEHELIKKMAQAVCAVYFSDPRDIEEQADGWQDEACAAISALPIPLADLLAVVNKESVIVPVPLLEAATTLKGEMALDKVILLQVKTAIQARPCHD